MPHRRRIRVGGIIRSGNDVLLQRRTDETVWALPGGKVEPGERLREALLRELTEEIGGRASFNIGPFAGCIDNAFSSGTTHTLELGLYFHVSALAIDPAPFTRSESNYTLEFRWFDVAALDRIDLRPPPMQQLLVAGQTFSEWGA